MQGSCRGVAQPGSALAWGARGREFESRRPDQENQALRPIFGLAFLLFVGWGNDQGNSCYVLAVAEGRG